MHLSIRRFLAVGLVGLDVAVASPCKPRSSASESPIATTEITAGTSSFTLSSDTSATFASTTTEAVTSADTTTEGTDLTATPTNTASTEAKTSGDATTETTTFATSTATTEATSTTGADTTTEAVTTSGTVTASSQITEAPATTTVPMFRLLPASSTYQGQPLLSNRVHFAPLLFNSAQGYTDAFFTIDTTTGRLLLDGTLPICGFFPGDGTSAFIECDATNMPDQEQYLTCETPTPGSQLECTVPEVQCSMFSGCTATGALWGTTYIGTSGGEPGMKALLGPPSMPGYTAVQFLVTFDSD